MRLALTVLVALAATISCVYASEWPEATRRPISVREVGTPLYKITERLSSPELRLVVGNELRETKAIVVVRERPLQEVLERMAQVFGARWVAVSTGGAPAHELRRTEPVAQWAARWKASRAEAAKAAREVRAARTRVYINTLIRQAFATPTRTEDPNAQPPGGIASVSLTRFLGTFPARDLDSLARGIAAGSELHSGGGFEEVPNPILYGFKDLSDAQQKALLGYIQEGYSGEPLRSVMAQLPDAQVGFRVNDAQEGVVMQGFVRLDVRLPDGKRLGDDAMSLKVSSDEMERLFHEALLERLSRATPADALLGASLHVEQVPDQVSQVVRRVVQVTPEVHLVDPDRSVSLAPLRPPGLLYRQFLPLLAEHAGLQVVSDYYTLSHRVTSGKEVPVKETHSLRDLLGAVAPTYRAVFRVEGRYLLGRNRHWPERDEEEAPFPLPEPWMEAKRERGGLPLEELLRVARLSRAQQNNLCAYDDGVVSFRREIDYLRRNRRLVAVLSTLSAAELAQMRKQPGLAIRTLKPQLQALLHEEFLRYGGEVPQEWQQAVLWLNQPETGPSPGRPALYALHPGTQPFWESRLPSGPAAPGRMRRRLPGAAP